MWHEKHFYWKKHIYSVVEKLFPDPFLKNQNSACLWINIVTFYTVCFYCIPSWGLSNCIETKQETASLYLMQSFFKKQKCIWNYNRVQKILEKLRKLRKSCNQSETLREYTMRSCTTIFCNHCRLYDSRLRILGN